MPRPRAELDEINAAAGKRGVELDWIFLEDDRPYDELESGGSEHED